MELIQLGIMKYAIYKYRNVDYIIHAARGGNISGQKMPSTQNNQYFTSLSVTF